MTLLLLALLAGAPDAQSRYATEATLPTTVRGESAPSIAPPGALEMDKLLHASISANLVLGFSTLGIAFGMHPDHATWLGVGLTLAIGIAREVLGNWDPLDLGADGVGILAGVGTLRLLVWRGTF